MIYNITMSTRKPPTVKTLGPVSARFVSEMQKQGKTTFTLDDAVIQYKKNRQQTSKFIHQLAKRDIVAKTKSGQYVLLQAGQETAQLTNWPLIAVRLVRSREYFISHLSAMNLHGMTTHPVLKIYTTVTKQQSTYAIKGISYHFIYCKQDNFWGTKWIWISKQDKVMVSDIERTILDGLGSPQLCGGVKDVARGIWAVKSKIDWDKLVKYAAKYRTKAAVKRLGFILELLELGSEHIDKLHDIVVNHHDYISLDPLSPKIGKRLKRWYVQMNINSEELKEGVWG